MLSALVNYLRVEFVELYDQLFQFTFSYTKIQAIRLRKTKSQLLLSSSMKLLLLEAKRSSLICKEKIVVLIPKVLHEQYYQRFQSQITIQVEKTHYSSQKKRWNSHLLVNRVWKERNKRSIETLKKLNQVKLKQRPKMSQTLRFSFLFYLHNLELKAKKLPIQKRMSFLKSQFKFQLHIPDQATVPSYEYLYQNHNLYGIQFKAKNIPDIFLS